MGRGIVRRVQNLLQLLSYQARSKECSLTGGRASGAPRGWVGFARLARAACRRQHATSRCGVNNQVQLP